MKKTLFIILTLAIILCIIGILISIDTFTDTPQTSTSSSITIKDDNITQENSPKVISHKEELVL